MKKYLIFALILLAGITAYPQATRSSRETKTEKSSDKKETKRSINRSEAKSEKKSSSDSQVRSRSDRRKTNADQSDRSNERSSGTQTRTSSRSDQQRSIGNIERHQSTGDRSVDRSEDRSDKRSARTTDQKTVTNQSGNPRESGSSANRDQTVRSGSSSASRVYRESKGTFKRDDGSVIHHQNDEVFASRKYKLDYDNYESLRRSDEFRRDYRDYDSWYNHRYVRVLPHNPNNHYVPMPWEQRRTRFYYRQPIHIDLIWTPLLFHRFMFYYPAQTTWDMEFGSPIETISAYDAQEYAGTVRRVYGKVAEVFYSSEDENYVLYIGAPFPYQDVSVVIPRYVAMNISRSPKWYFDDEFVWVVGLINIWEGKPEIVVRDEDQIRRY